MKEFNNRLKNNLSAGIIDLIKIHKCWLAGGAVLSIITKQEINDFDIYFASYDELESFYYELGGCSILSETPKSLMLQKDKYKLNLVFHNFYKTPQGIFNDFDFTICKAAWDGENFYFDDNFYKDVCSKSIVYTPSFKYPIASLLRVKKYEGRGYNISRNELIKICLQISQHKINDLKSLEEELGSIYGINLSKIYPKDTEFSIDTMIETLSNLDIDINDVQQEPTHSTPFIFLKYQKSIQTADGQFSIRDLREKNNNNNLLTYPIKLYKYVDKDMCSFYKKSFKYKLGTFIEDNHGVYCCFKNGLYNATYKDKKDKKLIELIVYHPDKLYVSSGNTFKTKKCYVNRIIENEN